MLSMTQSTESKEKKETTRVNGRFQDTTPTTPENASENPAQDGQDLLMLSVVVTEEATMLKVTTRMPRST